MSPYVFVVGIQAKHNIDVNSIFEFGSLSEESRTRPKRVAPETMLISISG
jgi:hypothetical protein